MTSAEYTVSSQPQNNSEPSWPPQIELTLKYIGRSRFECAAMYLIEKSLTANKYPRQAIAIVMHTVVPSAALRPLAINLSCLRRIPSTDATIEYAVTTQARARANCPICAMLVALSYAGCGFFLVFGRALGLHFAGDENAIMSKLAFDNGLRPTHER